MAAGSSASVANALSRNMVSRAVAVIRTDERPACDVIDGRPMIQRENGRAQGSGERARISICGQHDMEAGARRLYEGHVHLGFGRLVETALVHRRRSPQPPARWAGAGRNPRNAPGLSNEAVGPTPRRAQTAGRMRDLRSPPPVSFHRRLSEMPAPGRWWSPSRGTDPGSHRSSARAGSARFPAAEVPVRTTPP